MAEENKPQSGSPVAPGFINPQPTIEVVAPSTVTVADIKKDGTVDLKETGDDSSSVTFGQKPKVTPEGETGGQPKPEDTGTSSEEAPTEETTETTEAPSELPDFDFGNEETLKAYDAKYTTKDEAGDAVLNLNAFNDSLAASRDAGGKIDISANERAYLKKAFGISDQMIDTHIEGLVAKASQYDQKVFGDFGGEDRYKAAQEWAKTTGYTDAQKAAYNDALKHYQKTGEAGKLEEQLELLNSRYQKVSPSASASSGKTFRERRPSSPAKNAGASTTAASKVELFANSEEHRKAQNEAIASGDQSKIDAVRRKLQASMKQQGWA